MKTKQPDLMSRIKAGIAFLDIVYGKMWRKKIKKKKLDLSLEMWCPLGQISGSYGSARRALGLGDKAAYILGFHISEEGEHISSSNCEWKVLTEGWKKLLK